MTEYLQGVFVGIIALLVVGSMIGARIGGTPDSAFTDCAVGQDISLRDTTGTATFEVQFRDGEFVSMSCTSNPQAATEY